MNEENKYSGAEKTAEVCMIWPKAAKITMDGAF